MTHKSKIYTATGDRGTTSLVGGTRVSKDNIRLEAYGTVDELNAYIGMLNSHENIPSETRKLLLSIQNKLFNIGAYLATEAETGQQPEPFGLTTADIEKLERAIDILDSELPPLRNFVLPGGCRAASIAHLCRTICRRCERRIITLQNSGIYIHETIIKYINRLSDFFFILARFNNIHNQIDEIFWNKDC